MCCWHSLWLRCVSSKMDRHSLVTQGELLISQERDVLASALGSFEDKQHASPVDGVVYGERDETAGCGSLKGDTATSPVSFTLLLNPLPRSHGAHARGQPGSCTDPRLCTATVCVEPRPLVNPVTLEHTPVEAVKTAMWCKTTSLEIVCFEIQPRFFSPLWTLPAPRRL